MKKLVSDTIFITVGNLINKFKGIVFLPIIIGIVGLGDYGAFIIIFNHFKLITPFATLALGLGFPRFASQFGKEDRPELGRHVSSVLFPTIFFGALGAAVLFALAPIFNDLFLGGKHLASLQVSAILVLTNGIYTNMNKFLQSRKQFKLFSITTLCYGLLPYLAFIGGIVTHKNIHQGIVYYVVVDALVAAIVFLLVARQVPIVSPSIELFKSYFAWCWPLMLSNIQNGLLAKVDRFCIAYFLGDALVGVYNIIFRLCDAQDALAVPIRKQMMTYLSKSWDLGHQKESIGIIRQSLLAFLAISVGILTCIIYFFRDIIALLTTKNVDVPNLEWIVFLIGISVVFSSAKRFYYVLIGLKKETLNEFKYQLIGLVINLVLNITLIPILGLLGAGIATLVSFFVVVFMLNYKYSIELSYKSFLLIASFALIAQIILLIKHLIPFDNPFLLLITLFVSLTSYLVLNFLINRQFVFSVKETLSNYQNISTKKKG